jgi:hypothetical protein
MSKSNIIYENFIFLGKYVHDGLPLCIHLISSHFLIVFIPNVSAHQTLILNGNTIDNINYKVRRSVVP